MNLFLLLKFLLIFIVCVILSVQDIKSRTISWLIIAAGDVVMFFLQLMNKGLFTKDFDPFVFVYLLQALCMFCFYLLIRLIAGNKMGFGDVLFGTFIGLSVKWNYLYMTLVVTVILVDIYFLLIWKLKKINLQTIQVPFIPFMSAGLIAASVLAAFN